MNNKDKEAYIKLKLAKSTINPAIEIAKCWMHESTNTKEEKSKKSTPADKKGGRK